MSKETLYTSRIAIFSYDQGQYTEEEIDLLEKKILREVSTHQRVPGVDYYDEKKNHFIFQSMMYNSVAKEKVYFLYQVVPQEKSNIIKIN